MIQILSTLVVILLFSVVIYSLIKLFKNIRIKKGLTKFLFDNKDSAIEIIDKYVDGIYDLDIVIRIDDIDKIRDEWNELSKEEFKDLLYCKYSDGAVSDGFYLVKSYINDLKRKNVITVR